MSRAVKRGCDGTRFKELGMIWLDLAGNPAKKSIVLYTEPSYAPIDSDQAALALLRIIPRTTPRCFLLPVRLK
jgi:hypothetical protein